MAGTCVAPEIESSVEEKELRSVEPKQLEPRRPVRSLLSEIFEGHREYLGYTPD
jgi:hypothetical protein